MGIALEAAATSRSNSGPDLLGGWGRPQLCRQGCEAFGQCAGLGSCHRGEFDGCRRVAEWSEADGGVGRGRGGGYDGDAEAAFDHGDL